MRTFADINEFRAATGEHLGKSEWHLIDQDEIQRFAEITGDHQWIHVDHERAAKGVFGTTIAHGYLVLSLIPGLMKQIFTIEARSMGINYGLNRVRFPTPVPAGSRVRASADLARVEDIQGGIQAVYRVTIEVEGKEKPACFAETVARIYP